jgi:hypothetical protein
MRRVFGPRTVVEAAFLIAVPVTAAALGFGTWTIIAASAVAYLVIFVLEATLWREGSPAPGLSRLRLPSRNLRVQRPAATAAEPEPQAVVVVAPAAPVAEPAAAPVAAPAPVSVVDRAHEHVRVLPKTPEQAPEPVPQPVPPPAAPEPEPQPAPEPVVERVPLTAVPEPAPEPEPVLVAVAQPEPQTVVPIGVSSMPRQWNLFELERLTRESAGDDVARDEERQFLLMYLREFADSDGQLPIDFDGLVRDSFGELVGARWSDPQGCAPRLSARSHSSRSPLRSRSRTSHIARRAFRRPQATGTRRSLRPTRRRAASRRVPAVSRSASRRWASHIPCCRAV